MKWFGLCVGPTGRIGHRWMRNTNGGVGSDSKEEERGGPQIRQCGNKGELNT